MKYDMLFLIKRVTEGEIIFSVHIDLLSRSFCQFLAVFLHHLHHIHVFTYHTRQYKLKQYITEYCKPDFA